ncbi:disease resistance protein RGA2-like [Dioscorea cayenensis subsp. rotundata]|uniref:Disease resistance protein RGA2-like n=1 Tax=Dioscorea cayennensis subsp. rotundata TaxID=55577 RepID=A0AB40BU61_DIOCR|nr:disease resistance protein RGA2-like [Dioscorea cayenensis subsp. rotundata]
MAVLFSVAWKMMAGLFSIVWEVIMEILKASVLPAFIWRRVDDELEVLFKSLQLIPLRGDDAKYINLTEEADTDSWLSLLTDASRDFAAVQDITYMVNEHFGSQSEGGHPRSKVRDFFSQDHNPLLFKLQLVKKLTNVNERINGLSKKMQEFIPRFNKKKTSSCSYRHESLVIFGRDEEKNTVVEMLIRNWSDDRVVVVSIVGKRGMGKTSVAQLVLKDEVVKNQFELCIWVWVSDDFDVPKLAGKIIHTATREICDHTNMEVLQKDLRDVLGRKKYLLVLDDVCNEDSQKWDALRNILPDGAGGSRILVTTRNVKCSRVMGAQESLSLSHLSNESSWHLFEQKAFVIGAQRPPGLVEFAREHIEKCDGVPFLIEILAVCVRCSQCLAWSKQWKSRSKGIELSRQREQLSMGVERLRSCMPGGGYYNLLSTISFKQLAEQTIQYLHQIMQALKCITTNPFFLSAILICAIACFINFLFNDYSNQEVAME